MRRRKSGTHPTLHGFGDAYPGAPEAHGSGRGGCAVKRPTSSVGWTRCFVFRVGLLAPLAGVLLLGLAVAAGSLLVAGSALADLQLFRVEQSWHNFPNPPVTTPGGAGMYQWYIQPYTFRHPNGNYCYPAGYATVEPGNPVGGAFTLPQSFYTAMFHGLSTPPSQ
jgi:hypothetical protein